MLWDLKGASECLYWPPSSVEADRGSYNEYVYVSVYIHNISIYIYERETEREPHTYRKRERETKRERERESELTGVLRSAPPRFQKVHLEECSHPGLFGAFR